MREFASNASETVMKAHGQCKWNPHEGSRAKRARPPWRLAGSVSETTCRLASSASETTMKACGQHERDHHGDIRAVVPTRKTCRPEHPTISLVPTRYKRAADNNLHTQTRDNPISKAKKKRKRMKGIKKKKNEEKRR